MAPDLDTPWGHALPPFPNHSITLHVPKWSSIIQFIDNAQDFMSNVKSLYPRFGPFGSVKELVQRVSSDCLEEGNACLLFGSRDSAEACREFLMSENRKENKCEAKDVVLRAFDFHIRIWATSFPAASMAAALPFWQDPGTGISSRIATDCLEHYNLLKEAEYTSDQDHDGLSMKSEAFGVVRDRIADLLNRSPVSQPSKNVDSQDVFLYPTGMSAIYQLHRYLQQSSIRSGSTILFGFAFHSTPHVYKEYSSTFKWFGKGDENEMKQLEDFCASEADAGRQIQAVWLEFPSNPNIRTADLSRIRTLADKFGFFLIVDDTISSFCNVDLLNVADALVTSLTKSFSGYSDVMSGSVVLSPYSKHYQQLKELFDRKFVNELYSGDAEALEKNSRDYFERSKKLNESAFAVANYLQKCVENPSSAVSAVAYPSIGPGAEFYEPFMRPETPKFKSGFGCLLSVEIDSIESTVAFYDNLHVHHGPHLGANLTLALPYVKALHAKELQWLEECGMNEKMIRLSVGLEETDELVRTVKNAVEAADAVKRKDPLDKLVNPLS